MENFLHIRLTNRRLCIEINIAKFMFKYWFRLITLPTNRLAAHCYWTLFNKADLKDNWFDAIKKIITTTGQFDVWNNQVSLVFLQKNRLSRTQNYAIQALKDVYLQFANFKINSESKLYLFKNDLDFQGISKYLTNVNGRNRRKAIANFRLGTFDIELEKGRHTQSDRDSRTCKICNLRKIENEEHFLLVCPCFASVRKPFLERISKVHNNFVNLSLSEKLNFLFFNNELDANSLGIAGDMLLALQNRRDFLITLQRQIFKNQETKNDKFLRWAATSKKIEKVWKKI